MRRFLMSSVALAAMSATAFAADLPARVAAPVPAPVYVAPIFTWTGFYVGLNAGAAFRGDNNRADYVFDDPSGSVNSGLLADINSDLALARGNGDDDTGFTGGAQIGYNWQFGSLVVGIEADINAISRGDRNDGYTILNIAGSSYDLTVSGERRGSNWFATLRPRIGFAMDRTLLYVTGGLAYNGGSNRGGGSAYLTDPNNGDIVVADWQSNRRSGSDWGWTLGGGVEHAFSNNWTAKLEYLYVDLNRNKDNDYVSVGNGYPYDNIVGRRGSDENGMHVVRVGLNYKFGGGASSAPVLARY